MTSSLVGSEMCIRDSFKEQDQDKIVRVASEYSNYSRRQGKPVEEALARFCLLYTSDAADDM
eukprot:12134641-Prorocentrum_lima.AAC.1